MSNSGTQGVDTCITALSLIYVCTVSFKTHKNLQPNPDFVIHYLVDVIKEIYYNITIIDIYLNVIYPHQTEHLLLS
jgi:hypothetical protein